MQKKMVETIKAKDLFFSLSSRHSLTRPFGAGNSLVESTSGGASAYWPTAAAAAPCLLCSYDTSLMLQNIKSSIFFFNSMGLGPHAELSMVA